MAFFILSVFSYLFAGSPDPEAMLKDYLVSELKAYNSFEIVSVQFPAGVQEGTTDMKINTTKPCVINGGFAYIPVILRMAGKTPIYSVLTVKLQLFAYVWVATRPVGVGKELNEADFQLVEKELSKVRGNFVPREYRLDQAVAAMHINEGTILVKSMLRERPLIKHGDDLTAYISVGGAEISFSATARDNGYPGGTIRVISKDNKIYKAKVETENRVKIIE